MESIAKFWPLLVFAPVFGGFVYLYIGGRKVNPVESGLTPLFQEQAGGRFDIYNVTIPFVRHAIYDGFVVISTGKRYYKLDFDQIAKVEVKRHLFSVGVTYHHHLKNVPSKCIVWSRNPGFVEALLKSKGVKTNA